MAARVDVPVSAMVFAGEDKTLQFTVTNLAGATQVITGWTLQWKLETSQGGTVSVTKSGVVTDGPNGVCTVTLAAADTAALAGGRYWHVLNRTDSGFAGALAAGTFALQAR